MTPLTARDLMTADVVTVPPETPVVAIARLMADRGISAVPVLDRAGTLRGVVSEADLIRRLAGQADPPEGWFRSLFANLKDAADRYARTHGMTAADVMSEDPVTVAPDASAAEIARMLEEKHIRRLLVVEDGRLRGIVSRADLLRALTAPPPYEGALSDERIRRAVMAEMKKQSWADTFYTMVEVHDGQVQFHGFNRTEAARRALRVLAENIPGVTGVTDQTQPMPTYLYGGI